MGEVKRGKRLAAGVRSEQLRLPFDQYQRYRMVADAVELLREGEAPIRILDVGGGEGNILKFLTGDQVTILDRQGTEGVPGLIEGDATALPFDDGAFDYVASVDVYEHIEPGSRERYLSELRRTARRGVLLAAPFESEVVRGAERVANEFHRSVHWKENAWLKEHAENGLPGLGQTREFFEGRGDEVSVLPNGYIPHWLVMMCLTFYRPRLQPEPSGVFDRANSFYNEFMYGLDNTEPCYRHLLVALREPTNAELGRLASPEANPERASQSTAFFAVLSAMITMNAHLARREGVLARKEAQINDLSRRLAERVVAARSSRAQLEQRITRLQHDHDNMKNQRDQLRQQLAGIIGSRSWRLLTALHKLRLGIGKIFGSG
jgi:SAM-dependent methyltransferase